MTLPERVAYYSLYCNIPLIYYVTLVTIISFLNRFWKIFKVSVVSLLVLAASLVTFHFWLIAHAKNILAEIVRVQSKGRYHLEVKKVKYDYLKLSLELQQPVLKSADTGSSGDKFEMHARIISLQLEKLWPLIWGRRLLIDSIVMDRPILNLIHQKRSSYQSQKTAFSLSVEMEKLYQSIQSVLTTLKVGNFRINKGAFTLNSALQKNTPPLEIKNIDFYIKGFNIDSATNSLHPNSYTEDIQLIIAGQTIHFPDGDKLIRFSSFRFVANKGNLEVDSCSISGGDNDSTKASFNLFAEKMRIKNVYLAVNDSTGYNRMDSLFFTRPKVSFFVQIKDAKQDSSETITTAIRKVTSAAFGRILVRYVSINNVDFDIEVERKEKLSTFNFVQDSLVVSNLGVGLFPSMPLSASSIRFGVKEFVDYFRDSTYLVHFDSVRINNDQFSLFNINIESTAKVKKGHQKIYIPILQIKGIDWFQLISQKRLVASNFTLHDPFISILAAGNTKKRSPKKNSSLDRLLRQMFVLKNITILNGSVNYAFSANEYINVKKINTLITPDLSTRGLVASLQKMIRNFNTGELIYLKNGWKMTARNMIYDEHNNLTAANIDLTNSLRNLSIKANNVSIAGLSGKAAINSMDIKKINWENAKIVMDLSKKQQANTHSLLSIGSIDGGATELKLVSNKINIEAIIATIKTSAIVLENGKLKELHDFFSEGTSIDVTADNSKFHSGKFIIKDKLPSYISSLTASLPIGKRSISITIPEVDFTTDVQQSLSNSFDISRLSIIQPKINVNLNPFIKSTSSKKQTPFPEINLRNIEIKDPIFSFQSNSKVEPIQLMLGNSNISASGIKTSDNRRQLIFNDLQIQSKNFSLANKDSLLIFSSDSVVIAGSRAFMLYSDATISNSNWELKDVSVDIPNINLLNKRRSGKADTLQLNAVHLSNLTINQDSFKYPVNYFNTKPDAAVSTHNIIYKNDKSRFSLKGLKGSGNVLSLDSFSYRPQMNKDAFMAAQSFQKDYITLETGRSFLNDIDIASWLKDSVLRIGHIHISDALLNDSRDKHLPLQTNVIKELPVAIIKNIPVKTLIDSVSMSNSKMRYHEVSEKTNQTGNIRFTRLNATIHNIKNFDFVPNDSLQVMASAYLMDTAYMQLQMKEAYNDSLASFAVTLKALPFNLEILNPFMLPVMSFGIKSGIVDSLQVRAIGREDISLGEVRFFYHDLKVEFLKAANDQRKTLLTSLITFAANSFVIRTNNTKRVGKIYYERSRNRSFFNYLVRMIASGTASSVGAKRNQKYNRLYNDKIKEVNLPGIDY